MLTLATLKTTHDSDEVSSDGAYEEDRVRAPSFESTLKSDNSLDWNGSISARDRRRQNVVSIWEANNRKIKQECNVYQSS